MLVPRPWPTPRSRPRAPPGAPHESRRRAGDAAGRAVSGLTLPWAVLAHDNHRLVRRRQGKGLCASPDYRAKKAFASTLLAALWRGAPIASPVEVVGRVFFPDNRKRDAGNYRKMVTDALTGIAYVDDSLVHREVWERAGIDRSNPRIELTITPL